MKTLFSYLFLIFFIVSSAKAEELTQTQPQIAGYKNGFFIQTSDGNSRLSIGGYMQGLALVQFVEKAKDTYTFRVRRARLIFSGNLIDPRLEYLTEYDFAASKLLGAYIRWKTSDAIHFDVGQFYVPFNFEGLNSSSTLQLVDRSILHSYFGIADEREPGFAISGQVADHLLEYTLGVFNGEGINTLNQNRKFRYAARVNYSCNGKHTYSVADIENSPDPMLTVGVGAMFNDTPDASTIIAPSTVAKNDMKITSLTSDVTGKYKGLSGQVAYLFQHNDHETAASNSDHGWSAQAGYFLIPSEFEVAARVAQIKKGSGSDLGEYMLGFNYYVFGSQQFKLQLDYSALHTKNGVAVGNDRLDHRVRAQVQIKL